MILRLVQPDLAFIHVPARRFRLRFGQRHRRALRLIVQAGEDLALADGHAFLDVDLHDFPGNFRGHGRPPAGRHISRGVQHGGLRARLTLRHGDGFHLDGPFARKPPPGAAAGRSKNKDEREPSHPATARRSHGFAFELQRGKVCGEVRHW